MNKLKEIREKNNISVEKLAILVGVSARHIRFIETGDRLPSLKIAFKLAKTLKVKVDEIFLP